MKRILLAVVVMVLAVGAFGQGAPPTPGPDGPGMRHGHGMGAWWKNSDIAQKLNLTDQQKQQLESTFTSNRLALIDLRAAVEREETKLEPLMSADQLDENAIKAQLNSLIAARGKLEMAMAMMHVSMRKILTTEQWKQLQEMRPKHRERGAWGKVKGKDMGPGGMPPQGPPPPQPE